MMGPGKQEDKKGGKRVKIEIVGDPKEIAALVLAVQERQIRNDIFGKRVIKDDGSTDCAVAARPSGKSFG